MNKKHATSKAYSTPPDPYRAMVNEFTRYLDSLPGGPRMAWQEAAYSTYRADKTKTA